MLAVLRTKAGFKTKSCQDINGKVSVALDEGEEFICASKDENMAMAAAYRLAGDDKTANSYVEKAREARKASQNAPAVVHDGGEKVNP